MRRRARRRVAAWAFAAAVVFANGLTWATTYQTVTADCPLCGTKTTGEILSSWFVSGVTDDLRANDGSGGAGASMLSCRGCGFTAGMWRFRNPEGMDKDKVRAALAGVKSPPLFLRLDRAIAVERACGANPDSLAMLALSAKWLADDTGEADLVRQRLPPAIEALKAQEALASPQDPPGLEAGDRARRIYLIGELCRQAGRTGEAIQWLGRARTLPGRGSVGERAERQWFRARYAGSPSPVIVAAARKGSDSEKLGAVFLLREATDPEAVGFLTQFILAGPAKLRGPAMDVLVTPGPRRQHVPIFLKGLRVRDAAFVGESALGAAAFAPAQAKPLILEALQDEFCVRTHGLLWALEGLAREEDLPVLEKIAGGHLSREGAVTVILRLRLARSVPCIVKALRAESDWAPVEHEEWIPDLAAIGWPFVKALPDPETAAANDRLAVFAVRVLGAMGTPEALAKLRGVLARQDHLAVRAALELARRGDLSGRPIVLREIDRQGCAAFGNKEDLSAVLKPEDFDRLRERMRSEMAGLKMDAAARKLLLPGRSGAGPGSPDSVPSTRPGHRAAKDWMACRWMEVLGATGSPKARAILLSFQEHQDFRYREAAVAGLRHVYDKSVGDALFRAFPAEMCCVQVEILRTIRHAGDASRLEELLAIEKSPTLILTKVAWIQAMMKLHPNDAGPILTKWSTSPDAWLARKAAAALAALKSGGK